MGARTINSSLLFNIILLAWTTEHLTSLSCARASADTISNVVAGHTVSRCVVVSPAEFSLSWTERQSRKYVAEATENRRVVKLSFFTDEGEARRTWSGKGRSDTDYWTWERLYKKYGTPRGAVVETIAVSSGAVLRYRDQNGQTGRKVLFGTDPLMLSVGRSHFEVLGASFVDISRVIIPAEARLKVRGDYFVRAGAPLRVDSCEAAVRALAKRFDLQVMHATFRADEWFIENDGFPIAYPFSELPRAPTYAEYQETGSILCVYDQGTVRCREFSGRRR